MISLDSIIKGAGYPKPVEEEYLITFASLPYEEEIEIYQASWQRISEWFRSEVWTRRELLILEYALGTGYFVQEECNRMHHTVLGESLDKMELIPTADNLNELDGQLLHGRYLPG
jgi:hypothetical protein